MEVLSFTIDCIPPKTTAQQQKTAVIGGKPRRYDPKKVKEAKHDLLVLLFQHKPKSPIEGPIKVKIQWRYPWRASASKKEKAKG